MGSYDVKAEEEAIRKVLAGQRPVRRPWCEASTHVGQAGGLDAFFAELATGATGQSGDGSKPSVRQGTGIYASEFEFVSDALEEFITTPRSAPPQRHQMACAPAAFDCRHSCRRRTCANACRCCRSHICGNAGWSKSSSWRRPTARGRSELEQARSGTSTSTWPEAHFLAPLHPVMEWAADRALAELSRNEIFAVRGTVRRSRRSCCWHADQPTRPGGGGLLLHGASSPTRRTRRASPRRMTARAPQSRRWVLRPALNPGAWPDAGRPAAAASRLRSRPPAPPPTSRPRRPPRDRGARPRVDATARRWKRQADELIQRGSRYASVRRIEEEQSLAAAMIPDRRLVRPLLVVVPRDSVTTGGGIAMATATRSIVGEDWISEHYFTTDAKSESFQAKVIERRKAVGRRAEDGQPTTRSRSPRRGALARVLLGLAEHAGTDVLDDADARLRETLGFDDRGLLGIQRLGGHRRCSRARCWRRVPAG